MDILPAHVAIQVAIEKHLVLSFESYEQDIFTHPTIKRLTFRTAKRVGVACLMMSASNLELEINSQAAFRDLLYVLPHLRAIPYITSEDLISISVIYEEFLSFKMIRENASIFELILERAWASAFKETELSPDPAFIRFLERLLQSDAFWRKYEIRCIDPS